MDLHDIQQTPVWELYEKGRNFHRAMGIYSDTDRNFRFYNGDQWSGAKLGDVEPVQKNFIKPIVKYKQAVLHANLYALVFSAQEDPQGLCPKLDAWAGRAWEADGMDAKCRRLTKRAAINDEGILYIDFDRELGLPRSEIIKKCDIYYGNENDDDLQSQPYILLRRRMSLSAAREFAAGFGLPEEKRQLLVGDNDTFELGGDAARREVDPMVTLVYKLYKEAGIVKFDLAGRWVSILSGASTGLSLYPIAHMLWEEKEGSARGEGEVRHLIPNQIEVNRTEMRRVLTVKQQAYPLKVVDVSKVSNPEAMNTVGGVIRTNGQPVEDVRHVVGTIAPARMSPDVKSLQDDLIAVTRELAGAGDIATGQINPATASGRAILAVQQASQAPMTEQRESFKAFLEDVAKIWLEYLSLYGREIPAGALKGLRARVKIDVTPKSVYDRFAQEQTIENLLVQGFFSPQRVGELEAYALSLDSDAVAPREKILKIASSIRQQMEEVARIQARGKMLAQEYDQLLKNLEGNV